MHKKMFSIQSTNIVQTLYEEYIARIQTVHRKNTLKYKFCANDSEQKL